MNRKGFILMDALFAFMVMTSIVIVLLLSIVQLHTHYTKLHQDYPQLIEQWQNTALHS